MVSRTLAYCSQLMSPPSVFVRIKKNDWGPRYSLLNIGVAGPGRAGAALSGPCMGIFFLQILKTHSLRSFVIMSHTDFRSLSIEKLEPSCRSLRAQYGSNTSTVCKKPTMQIYSLTVHIYCPNHSLA